MKKASPYPITTACRCTICDNCFIAISAASPMPAGHGRRRADGDEAVVADRAPAGGGDGIWRRLLHADAVLSRPDFAGRVSEKAGLRVDRTGALTPRHIANRPRCIYK